MQNGGLSNNYSGALADRGNSKLQLTMDIVACSVKSNIIAIDRSGQCSISIATSHGAHRPSSGCSIGGHSSDVD